MKKNRINNPKHLVMTSSAPEKGKVSKIVWGAKTLQERGPLITRSTANHTLSNVIGSYAGTYAMYRGIAVATGKLNPLYVHDFTNTEPAEKLVPHKQWFNPDKIVSLDPWGHMAGETFNNLRLKGLDIRPTIAITKAHINIPEIRDAIKAGRLKLDNIILKKNGDIKVTKVAIDPVWYLPGIANRFNITEPDLRRALFDHSGGMFPELITRPDLKVLLPPIGGHTLYIVGDPATLHDPNIKLTCRLHDECNGSDVFGSNICTCRPYLCHGIELCINTAQQGGNGLIVYNRKEGRALGEVAKFLVYNARERQKGGDSADKYFKRTECIAGVEDMRFQELIPDIFHWLGIKKIDRFASMSASKYNALTHAGIDVLERVEIPPELIPANANIEIEAKKAAGYFTKEEETSGTIH